MRVSLLNSLKFVRYIKVYGFLILFCVMTACINSNMQEFTFKLSETDKQIIMTSGVLLPVSISKDGRFSAYLTIMDLTEQKQNMVRDILGCSSTFATQLKTSSNVVVYDNYHNKVVAKDGRKQICSTHRQLGTNNLSVGLMNMYVPLRKGDYYIEIQLKGNNPNFNLILKEKIIIEFTEYHQRK